MGKRKSAVTTVISWLATWAAVVLIGLRAAEVVAWPWYVLLSPLFLHVVLVVLCAAMAAANH